MRDREQRARPSQHALPAFGKRARGVGNAEHADRMAARRQRQTQVPGDGDGVRFPRAFRRER